MKLYNHFTQMNICCLFYLLQLGVSQSQIARTLNKHRSSVSRLIKRCPGGTYNPETSYENYLESRSMVIEVNIVAYNLKKQFMIYQQRLNIVNDLMIGRVIPYVQHPEKVVS